MVAFKKLPWVAVDPLDWAGGVSHALETMQKVTYCNSPGYHPSATFAWKRERRRYRYLGLYCQY